MLAPWKESCHKLSVLKSRDITLLIKVCTVKAMIFPVVVYGCESWIIKRAKHRRMTLSIVVLEKTLESPVDSIEVKPALKEINPEYSLEGLMLKLKLQYFGHLM